MTVEKFLELGITDRYVYLSKILRYHDSLDESETEAKLGIMTEFNLLSTFANN